MHDNIGLESPLQSTLKSEHQSKTGPRMYRSSYDLVISAFKRKRRLVGVLVAASTLTVTTHVLFNYSQSRVTYDPAPLGSLGTPLPSLPSYKLDPDIAHNLGAYSARYIVPSPISTEIPLGCNVVMVSILQRHGARYPTESTGRAIERTLDRAKTARSINSHLLKFVRSYTYSYTAEELVDFGRNQSYISGRIIAQKYPTLGASSFVRTPPLNRVVESSRWWRQGFEGGPLNVPISSLPHPDLIISVANNTLNVTTCENANTLHPKPGKIARRGWTSRFAPSITLRLNKQLPGAQLTDADTINLMNLCGFDTAARNGTASPWCNVFSKSEFKSYEYLIDLDKYYSYSYGSKYAPSEGVGWVNELLARLNGTAVEDNTTTNTTLDANFATFPVGPQAPKVFADFSTDNNIARILSTIGVLRDREKLPIDVIGSSDRKFYVSKIVPFAGSTVVEKLTCSANPITKSPGEYVRILVNDAVVQLNETNCGLLGRNHGLCSLDGFLDSQRFAQDGGRWESCFEDTT